MGARQVGDAFLYDHGSVAAVNKIFKAVALGAGALLIFGGKRVSQTISSLIDRGVAAGQASAFRAALPGPMNAYADLILDAAATYAISPWLIAGVMWAESNAGAALTPPGPGGTGDFGIRDPAKWTTAAANGLPPDGGGWGRGLMQIDYGVHNAWVISHPWGDARTNVLKGAEIIASALQTFSTRQILDSRYTDGNTVATGTLLQSKLGIPANSVFPDPRPLVGDALYGAVLASFNAGQLQVLQAIASGHPPETVTYRHDYVSWILSRVQGWAQALS